MLTDSISRQYGPNGAPITSKRRIPDYKKSYDESFFTFKEHESAAYAALAALEENRMLLIKIGEVAYSEKTAATMELDELSHSVWNYLGWNKQRMQDLGDVIQYLNRVEAVRMHTYAQVLLGVKQLRTYAVDLRVLRARLETLAGGANVFPDQVELAAIRQCMHNTGLMSNSLTGTIHIPALELTEKLIDPPH